MKYSVLILFFSLLVVGCGGGGDSPTNLYEGNWRSTSADYYLEIGSDNSVALRVCSINDGYRVAYTGTITGDSLNVNLVNYSISLVGDVLTIADAVSGISLEFTKEVSIPTVCTGDAIEITFVSPMTVTEGQLTTFMVNFDYRLTSMSNAIVYLGFNTDNAEDALLTNSTLLINSTGTGSGSLSAEVVPVLYASPYYFFAYINLSESPHPATWTPLASDDLPLTVNPAIMVNNTMPLIGTSTQAKNISSCADRFLMSCQ